MKEKIRFIHKLKNICFFTALGILAVIGLMWFWRPQVSEIEKRELTAFPKLTAAGLMDGSFAGEVDKWYADTYPLRELFIEGKYRLESLYGDRSEQLIIKDPQGDDIPPVGDDIPPVTQPTAPQETKPAQTEGTDPASEPPQTDSTQPPATEPPATEPPATEPPATEPSDGTGAEGEVMGSIYVSKDSAYSLYYFNRSATETYAALVNRAHQLLGDGVQVYSIVIPLSSGIVLDQSVRSRLGASDQRAAIEYINSLMDPAVHALNIYDALYEHRSEYIYFRTDHHWTALGAYYAYREFCRAKGVTAHTLDQFEEREYPGFLGTFYSDTRSAAMKNNPDTVMAWVPMGTNSMIFVDTKGNETKWNVVRNVSGSAASGKYYCFAGSDQPYAYAHNPAITDGSACVVIKDSFGNAFIPFMIDHYEHIYWIDFRYYKGTLPDLVQEKSINDVIFCFNIYNPSSSGALSLMKRLVPGS